MSIELAPNLRALLVQRTRTYLFDELFQDANLSNQNFGPDHEY